jgi:hypothetical protein
VLSALAIWTGTLSLSGTLADYVSLFPLSVWLIPTVFFINVFRFMIGDLAMSAVAQDRAHHEESSSASALSKSHRSSENPIYYYSMVTAEGIIFMLMGNFLARSEGTFLILLALLSFVDFVWVYAAIPFRLRIRMPLRPLISRATVDVLYMAVILAGYSFSRTFLVEPLKLIILVLTIAFALIEVVWLSPYYREGPSIRRYEYRSED